MAKPDSLKSKIEVEIPKIKVARIKIRDKMKCLRVSDFGDRLFGLIKILYTDKTTKKNRKTVASINENSLISRNTKWNKNNMKINI